MQKLKFINSKGVEIDFTSGRYGVTEWSGFSNSDLNIQSQQVPFQDGSVFLDALYNPRELSITLAINDENDLEKRYELKRELIAVMNAKLGEGYLYYKNDFIEKRIKVIPQLPIFENKNSNDAGTLKASLSWSAPEFYWEDVEETSVELESGVRTVVNNNGDIPCSVKVELNTTNIENPKIINLTENKEISLKGEFTDNILIDTGIGKKKVIKEKMGVDYIIGDNDFNYIASGKNEVIIVNNSNNIILETKNGTDYKLKNIDSPVGPLAYNSKQNYYIMAGRTGWIYTKDDGSDWKILDYEPGHINSNYCIYCDFLNSCIAVTSTNKILIWDYTKNLTVKAPTFAGVVTGIISVEKQQKIYVITSYGKIYRTGNLENWQLCYENEETIQLNCIAYSSTSGFIVFGGYSSDLFKLTSESGSSWTKTVAYSQYNDIIYTEQTNEFYAVSTKVNRKNDIESSFQEILDGVYALNKVIFSESLNLLFSIGEYGTIFVLSGQDVIFKQQIAGDSNFKKIIFSKNRNKYYMITTTGIYSSLNLKSFIREVPFGWYYFKDIIENTDTNEIIVCGSSYVYINTNDVWNSYRLEEIDNLNKIIYVKEKSLYFGIVNNELYSSENAINWNTVYTFQDSINDIIYDEENMLFILLIENLGAITFSDDLINWYNVIVENNVNLLHIHIYNDKYIVHSNKYCYFKNRNDYNWNKSTFNSDNIQDIAYNEISHKYIAMAFTNNVEFSNNLLTWDLKNILISDNFYFIQYDENLKNILFLGSNEILNLIIENTYNSLISYLSPESDMNLNLKIGDNVICVQKKYGNITARLTYRQKYLGV